VAVIGTNEEHGEKIRNKPQSKSGKLSNTNSNGNKLDCPRIRSKLR